MRSEREDLRAKDGASGNTSIKVQEEKGHRIEKRQKEVEKWAGKHVTKSREEDATYGVKCWKEANYFLHLLSATLPKNLF